MPQNIFSTVCPGRKKVQLVVISGHDFIDLAIVFQLRMRVLWQGVICEFVEKFRALNVKYSI